MGKEERQWCKLSLVIAPGLPASKLMAMSSSIFNRHSAALHDAAKMGTFDSGARKGIPVLLLKTKSTPNDGYEERFSIVNEGQRFEPVFVPVLEHRFLEEGLSVVRRLLQNKQISKAVDAIYGGLIFTSQRSVEAFAKLVKEGKGKLCSD